MTVLAREVVRRVRSKEKGDLLKRFECGAGKAIVAEEVGEGRNYGVALGGVVGAGKDHVELVTEGVGGAVRAEAKLVGDVPAGGRERNWWGGRCLGIAAEGGGWRRVWGEGGGKARGGTSSGDARARCIGGGGRPVRWCGGTQGRGGGCVHAKDRRQ